MVDEANPAPEVEAATPLGAERWVLRRRIDEARDTLIELRVRTPTSRVHSSTTGAARVCDYLPHLLPALLAPLQLPHCPHALTR